MKQRMTTKEACELTGRSQSFLRDNVCGWCDQKLIYAIKDGCGAYFDWPACDPREPKPWWKTEQK